MHALAHWHSGALTLLALCTPALPPLLPLLYDSDTMRPLRLSAFCTVLGPAALLPQNGLFVSNLAGYESFRLLVRAIGSGKYFVCER